MNVVMNDTNDYGLRFVVLRDDVSFGVEEKMMMKDVAGEDH